MSEIRLRRKRGKPPPSRNDFHINARVKAKRLERGLTIEDIAEHIGVTAQQFSKYEIGDNRMSVGRLFDVAVALQTPIAWFFEGLPIDRKPPTTSGTPRVKVRRLNPVTDGCHVYEPKT